MRIHFSRRIRPSFFSVEWRSPAQRNPGRMLLNQGVDRYLLVPGEELKPGAFRTAMPGHPPIMIRPIIRPDENVEDHVIDQVCDIELYWQLRVTESVRVVSEHALIARAIAQRIRLQQLSP